MSPRSAAQLEKSVSLDFPAVQHQQLEVGARQDGRKLVVVDQPGVDKSDRLLRVFIPTANQ
jgi:hypothetical protein